jgi:hypothetical protein
VLSTGYIYGITNVVADWIFTLIPIVILMDSTMDRRSKISVGIVMAFAAVGSISGIMRMVYLKGLLFEGSVSSKSLYHGTKLKAGRLHYVSSRRAATMRSLGF